MRNGDLAKLFPAKPLATRSLTPSGRFGAKELVFLSGELASAGVNPTRAQLPLILNAFLDHPQE